MGGALSGTLGSPGALRTESLPTRAPLWGSRNRLLSRREHGIVRGYLRLFLCVIFHRVCRVICGVVAWVPCEAWRPMTTPTTRPAAGRGAGRARGKEKKVGAVCRGAAGAACGAEGAVFVVEARSGFLFLHNSVLTQDPFTRSHLIPDTV